MGPTPGPTPPCLGRVDAGPQNLTKARPGAVQLLRLLRSHHISLPPRRPQNKPSRLVFCGPPGARLRSTSTVTEKTKKPLGMRSVLKPSLCLLFFPFINLLISIRVLAIFLLLFDLYIVLANSRTVVLCFRVESRLRFGFWKLQSPAKFPKP